MAPLVSIILPTFNRLKYLAATIQSVFAQTLKDWELIIADDGSDAYTLNYLTTLEEDPRIKLLRLPHSGNPPAVRNAAIRAATGRYVAFIDSDDLWSPRKLELQLASLHRRADRHWSYTGFTLVNQTGSPLDRAPAAQSSRSQGWILVPLLRMEAMVVQSSVIATRELLDAVQGYDESFPVCGDYDLWLRLAQRSAADHIADSLVQVRRHADHYSDDITACQDFQRVLDKTQRICTAPHLKTLIRRRRADASTVLAKSCAVHGAKLRLIGTLFSSAPYAWRYARWWRGVTVAVARAYTSPRLRRAMRRSQR